jgi:hypothetical protein
LIEGLEPAHPDGVPRSCDLAVGVVEPTRDEIENRWRQLLDGTVTREEVSAWAARWVRREGECGDLIVELGLLHLFGFDLSRPADIATGTSGVLQKHGGGAGRVYLSSAADIATELGGWRRDARSFDRDPADWRRDRLHELLRRMGAEGRLEESSRVRRMFNRPDHIAPSQ